MRRQRIGAEGKRGALEAANLEALAYWASGLEPIFFEGAFERARPIEN